MIQKKKEIHAVLLQLIDGKIKSAKLAMDDAMESKTNETKSSAGDKFETGRAMMQAEEDRNKVQWQKASQLRMVLHQIKIENTSERVKQGSLVMTNHGSYYISIGWGKINIDSEIFYAISLASPLGQMFAGHQVDDRIVFQNKEFLIHDIV